MEKSAFVPFCVLLLEIVSKKTISTSASGFCFLFPVIFNFRFSLSTFDFHHPIQVFTSYFRFSILASGSSFYTTGFLSNCRVLTCNFHYSLPVSLTISGFHLQLSVLTSHFWFSPSTSGSLYHIGFSRPITDFYFPLPVFNFHLHFRCSILIFCSHLSILIFAS